MIIDAFLSVLLFANCIALIIIIMKLFHLKNKIQSQHWFLMSAIAAFIWSSGKLLQIFTQLILGHTYDFLIYYYSIGLYLAPNFSLLFIILFVKPETKLNYKHFLLFLIPIVRIGLVLTNEYHHLMYIKYAIDDSVIYGICIKYFTIIDVLFYFYMVVYLMYYLFNNFKIFFKQALIIALGFLLPFISGLIFVLKIIEIPLYANSICIGFSTLIIYYGMTKCNLFEINPISLKVILDAISDCFIVVDQNYKVVGYNQSFQNQFKALGFEISTNFLDNFNNDKFHHHLEKVLMQNGDEKFDFIFSRDNIKKYYFVEMLPLIINNDIIGIVIIFKDVTELTEKNLQLENLLDELKGMQDILVLNERYSSLGMLFGGLAHNLKSPLMAISANVNILQDLVVEYKTSISDNKVTIEDHKEIAADMEGWLSKTNLALEYISNTLNSIKGQISNYKNEEKFKISDVLECVKIITKYEENNSKCVFNVNNLLEDDLELDGSLNCLVQVINNFIINSKQAYNQENGIIQFSVYKKDQHIVFMIKDFGIGIHKDIQSKLFKEMVTTKGKNGMGLGLYISYSIIKLRFKGEIWFESEPEKGTTFYIGIPL